MDKPRLGYWNVRGLVEPIRYLLHYKGVDFADVRYSLDDPVSWTKEKFSLDLDFPNLPYFIDGDVKLTQSIAILRHLAEKHRLAGETPEEERFAWMVEQELMDFRRSLKKVCHSEDFEVQKPEFVHRVPEQMKRYAAFLQDKKFLISDTVTYVDFMAYETFDFYRFLIPNLLEEFESLMAYHQRMRDLPELQTYLRSKAYRRWPIFGPGAVFGGKGPEPSGVP